MCNFTSGDMKALLLKSIPNIIISLSACQILTLGHFNGLFFLPDRDFLTQQTMPVLTRIACTTGIICLAGIAHPNKDYLPCQGLPITARNTCPDSICLH